MMIMMISMMAMVILIVIVEVVGNDDADYMTLITTLKFTNRIATQNCKSSPTD